MHSDNKYIALSIVFLGISIVVHGIFTSRNEVERKEESVVSTIYNDTELLSLSEAAGIMSLSEDDIRNIIKTEEEHIKKSGGSFTGHKFPYITVGNKYLFSKVALIKWAEESAGMGRAYFFGGQEGPSMW